ncbi:sensor histidine kinase [Qiania dongpingensis]|uniref:histidine kinase n=1 Tax=Qiania dongpingensis TaxID=2763669 RepID=A0A7G9G437_9FIRM|nr:HAMP domain-containing sensor histidine kinase [Qiania dongpingensis]QNM05569.1 HAMP domain-containing histidine kinase [Qiania dongpingensis]
MIKKLKRKFILINMILISIVLVITFAVVCAVTYNRLCRESYDVMERRVMRELPGLPENAEDRYGKKSMQPGPDRPFLMTDAKEGATFVVKLEQDGSVKEVIGENLVIEDEVLEDIVALCLSQDKERGTVKGMGLRYLKYSDINGTQIVFMDRSDEVSSMKSLIFISLLVGIGSLAVFLVISVCLAGWVVGPVKDSWDRERQFVADASHELKTPLTVILANTGILLSHKEDSIADQVKWVENTRTEAVRMKDLVNDLLELAKADAGTDRPVLSRLNLSDLVWSAALPFESVMFEQGKKLDTAVEPEIYVSGDEGRLRQLLAILLDNACKYAEEKGVVTLSLLGSKDKGKLSVHNTGSYIEKEQLPHVFERFYRGEKSRSRDAGGYGLGLSIASNIAESHAGRISVQSGKEEGTTFFVTLPRLKP